MLTAAPRTRALAGCCLQLCGCFGAAPAPGRRSTSPPLGLPWLRTRPGSTFLRRWPTSPPAACILHLARGTASAPACSAATTTARQSLTPASIGREARLAKRTASSAKYASWQAECSLSQKLSHTGARPSGATPASGAHTLQAAACHADTHCSEAAAVLVSAYSRLRMSSVCARSQHVSER